MARSFERRESIRCRLQARVRPSERLMPTRTFVFVLLFGAAAFGQASFDFQSPACGYVFPAACWIGDPEGISFNGVLTWDVPAFGATVATGNGLGMPVDGQQ